MKKNTIKYICMFFAMSVCSSNIFSQDSIQNSKQEIAPPLFSGAQGFRTWSFGLHAEAVMNYLISKGANPSSIEAIGYGEKMPIASNKNASGRQMNRRVEFLIY